MFHKPTFQPQFSTYPTRYPRGALCALTSLALAFHAAPAVATCYELAAQQHGVNPLLLKAIAHVESSGNPNAVNINRQFSRYNEDIGLMQINSNWLPELAKFGIQRDDLFNPCVNVHVGAWILARQMRTYGNTWQAVGAYHSVTPHLNTRYAQRVHQQLLRWGVR